MNKVIAAFDGLRYSESTVEYAIDVATLSESHLTGIFLDDRTYTSYKIYELVLDHGVSEQKLKMLKEKDNQTRALSAEKFEVRCRKAGLTFNIHHDKNIALQDLLHETVYSDLLVINHSESFTHYEEEYPTRFIRDLLSNSQSPVYLVPKIYKKIEKLVFLFDGTNTSVYAIKMFNYLFPQFNKNLVELICIKNMDSTLHIPDYQLLKEFLKRHYVNIKFTVLKGIPELEIVNHLKFEENNILVVLGAYRRTMLSRWFKSSMADALIKELKLPLFIAHNK